MKSLFLVLFCLCFQVNQALANMPPKEYDFPFQGKLEKHLVTYGNAARLCNKLNPDYKTPSYVSGRKLFGCQFFRENGTCVIVYSYDPTGNDKKMSSNVFRHEQAHCNGWSSNHPNALP